MLKGDIAECYRLLHILMNTKSFVLSAKDSINTTELELSGGYPTPETLIN